MQWRTNFDVDDAWRTLPIKPDGARPLSILRRIHSIRVDPVHRTFFGMQALAKPFGRSLKVRSDFCTIFPLFGRWYRIANWRNVIDGKSGVSRVGELYGPAFVGELQRVWKGLELASPTACERGDAQSSCQADQDGHRGDAAVRDL